MTFLGQKKAGNTAEHVGRAEDSLAGKTIYRGPRVGPNSAGKTDTAGEDLKKTEALLNAEVASEERATMVLNEPI